MSHWREFLCTWSYSPIPHPQSSQTQTAVYSRSPFFPLKLCFLHPLDFICSRVGRLLLIRSKSSCLEGECAWNSTLCILSVREPLGLFSPSQNPSSRACASVYSTSPHLWVCCFNLRFQFRLVLHPMWKRNQETNPCTSEPSWAGAARF